MTSPTCDLFPGVSWSQGGGCGARTGRHLSARQLGSSSVLGAFRAVGTHGGSRLVGTQPVLVACDTLKNSTRRSPS